VNCEAISNENATSHGKRDVARARAVLLLPQMRPEDSIRHTGLENTRGEPLNGNGDGAGGISSM
jgi:hypothetical protein